MVQTCGHYVHADCHASYMKALERDLNSQLLLSPMTALQIDKGEFYCPLCRRLANGVLPLVPAGLEEDACEGMNAREILEWLQKLLQEPLSTSIVSSNHSTALW